MVNHSTLAKVIVQKGDKNKLCQSFLEEIYNLIQYFSK